MPWGRPGGGLGELWVASSHHPSPVGQEGPLRLLEGAGAGGGPAAVQHQGQAGVRPLQEPDLHGDGLQEQPHQGVVPLLVEGTESLVCGQRAREPRAGSPTSGRRRKRVEEKRGHRTLGDPQLEAQGPRLGHGDGRRGREDSRLEGQEVTAIEDAASLKPEVRARGGGGSGQRQAGGHLGSLG